MDEYIERNKLIQAFEEQLKEHGEPNVVCQPVAYGSKLGIMYGLSIAQTITAADAVQVVRCKDCKYRRDLDGGVKCDRMDGLLMTLPDDYCSYGRKSTGDEV